ncbi:biotin/lipoyl-binding carrier protein [Sphingomonas crusticola]|uniref:biotin/lipoyl-binding carrier protein n=1 Tax=Sphingomonas crusticola TaxID=1697973 RepID=UPI00196757E4|nr:biotin/lipoyl-binding carrier protein [Sphingomonas crusticola]
MREFKVVNECQGVVIAVEASPGTQVEEGDTLILLESMKMEIPVAAPRAGRVGTISVAIGDVVAEDQLLAVLELD